MMLLACGLCWAVPRPEIPRPEILQGPTRTSWYRIWQQADHDLWGSGLQSNSCSPHAWVCAEIHRTQSYRRFNAQPTTQLLGSYVASNSGSSKEITLLKGKTKLFTAYVCQSKVMSLIANGDVIDVRTGVTSLNRTPLLFQSTNGRWNAKPRICLRHISTTCYSYIRLRNRSHCWKVNILIKTVPPSIVDNFIILN